MAVASPAVSTISRRTVTVCCSPVCSKRSIVFRPSTVAETQQGRFALNATVSRSTDAVVTAGTAFAATGTAAGAGTEAGVLDDTVGAGSGEATGVSTAGAGGAAAAGS